MTPTLARWLAERSRDELAAILARRPETLGARHLGEVASRLSVPYGIETVLRDLPKPCVELLETIAVYGAAGIDVDDLASVLGVDVDDRLFSAALDVCQWWAVAWVVDGDVYVASALTAALPRPLHLGPRIADLLAPRAVDDLRTRASALGLNPTARKHDLVAAIADFYRDGDAVRALYAAAPSAQRERLAEAAWRGPALDYGGSFFYTGRPDPAIAWLLTHGLVIADWQQIVVPREVALAIRGDDWHPTLTPRPDVETTVGVSIDVVDEDAAAAAALATEHMTLVVDACEVTPPTLLKTGGVGVRDLRRIAKATALPEPAVRLWLTLALDVGLIDVEDDGLVPTPGYDAWLAEPPSQRLAMLVDAWWDLRTVPTLVDRPDDSPPRPVLADDAYATVAARSARGPPVGGDRDPGRPGSRGRSWPGRRGRVAATGDGTTSHRRALRRGRVVGRGALARRGGARDPLDPGSGRTRRRGRRCRDRPVAARGAATAHRCGRTVGADRRRRLADVAGAYARRDLPS